MRKLLTTALLAGSVLALSTSAAFAQSYAYIDYVGFGWEDGGVPTSNPGDELQLLLVADQIDAIFGVDLSSEEATMYIYGLTSTGEVPIGGGSVMIGFTGGTIEVYEDPAQDHDWGSVNPMSYVGSFTNGNLLFQGQFTDFTLFLDSFGAGAFDGVIDGIGGTVATTCTDCAYTFGGAFTRDTGAQIPDGYHLQVDGQLEVDRTVSTETSSWGSVKSLFRN